MNASRVTVLRSGARSIRARPARQAFGRRFQSTSSTNPPQGHSTQAAIYGGLAGGTGALVLGYMWYHFSGAKSVVNTAKQAKQTYESAASKLKDQAPAPNEALDWLRKQASFYAGFVPGGRQFVDSTFNDVDAIRSKHGEKVDKIVNDAYNELKGVSNKGLNFDSAQDAWKVIEKALRRIGELAGDAAQDILNNHPDIKNKMGGNIEQLRSMGDKLGPEAKKQVDQTWEQVQDILKGGIGFTTIDKIRKLVQDKTQELKRLGDQAWQKGIQEAKPYLDRNPKIKELIENNQSALKSGNVVELWEQVKQASSSGNTQQLEDYVKDAAQKAKESGSGGGLERYFNMIPGGSELLPKFQQIQQIGQQHGDEAEKLVKETISEVQQVLSKKLDEGKKLADKVGKEAGK